MDDLFPLPVTPFEYYYLCDDRSDYPTTFPFELSLTGRLERGPFEAALKNVLPRHPLLTARIDLNNGGRPNWVAGDAPPLDWAEEESPPGSPEGQRIDLTQSPGLRVMVRQGPETSRIVFEFHHASCDGRGGCQFIEEVLLAYHAACESGCVSLPPVDPLRLRVRGEFGDNNPNWRAGLREVWRTIAFWAPLLARSPTALAAPADLSQSDSIPLPCRTRVLNREQVGLLHAAATAQQATLNDLLLRDLLLVVADWNTAHGLRPGWLRINVPISRRERRMPAANLLSFAFVTRRLQAGADLGRLLSSIRRETEQIKRDRGKRYFVQGLAFACGIRGLVPWVLSWKQSFATIVLSNVGTVFARTSLPRRDGKLVCGQTVLERVTAVPPIRPLTRASLAVVHYAGELTVNLRCDSKGFRPEHADELLARYIARLDQSAAVNRVPTQSTLPRSPATHPVSP